MNGGQDLVVVMVGGTADCAAAGTALRVAVAVRMLIARVAVRIIAASKALWLRLSAPQMPA